MAKYTLIIADDEEIERKALRLLVQKEFPEIEIVAVADNGTELVAQVQRHQPDIAIVDVNMPGINGIDAIDLLCARGSRTHFIINTAYDEFDYVQRALALKIDAYILKPEKRDTTIGTIRKLCAQIDEARANIQSQRQIQELFTRIQPVMESEIMYSLFIGEPAAANFDAYCEMHAAQFEAGAVAALIPVAEGRDGLRGQDKAALRTALDAAFGNSCTYLATVTETNICLLIFTPGGSAAEQRRWLSDVLRVAMDKLNHSLRLPLRAGVGGIFGEFEKMAASYQQSLLALTGPAGGGVAFYEPRGGQGAARREGAAQAQALACLAREGNLQRIGAETTRLQPLLRGDRAAARQLWADVMQELRREAEENAPLREQLEKTAAELERMDAGADFSVPLREGLYQAVMLLGAQPEEGTGAYVRQALQYIGDNYARDISLDTVAEQIGISPFYLSRLFKAERGETFVEYLTGVRMKAATRLAKETRLSIREIAERTGYGNPTYFCRVFKKYTGSTIGDLREQGRKKRF